MEWLQQFTLNVHTGNTTSLPWAPCQAPRSRDQLSPQGFYQPVIISGLLEYHLKLLL